MEEREERIKFKLISKWIFTRWYYYLFVLLDIFVIRSDGVDLYSPGFTLGWITGSFILIFIIFFIGRIIYLKVSKRKS